jgi:DNA invertase Pin-like site-specific DNA recombinase
MMKGCKVGYIRVSSLEQNPERQLEGIELHHSFIERLSGKNRERPKLEEMLRFIRIGDEVYVHSMDRLARNLEDLLHLVKEILNKGCSIHFVKEKLEFSSDESNPMGKLMLSIFGAIAEFERALIRDRQREGIEIAKRKGKYKGRPNSLTQEQVQEIIRLYPAVHKAELGRRFNLHPNTITKYLNSSRI